MLSRRSLIAFGASLTLAAAASRGASAADEVVLTISGKIAPPDRQTEARFAMRDLEAMQQASFTTHTPWYADSCRFEGVPMSRLMAAVGAAGQTAHISALNDYAADVPLSDFAAYQPILALRRDGAPMPISDKGPLFLIYPFDALPVLQHQSFYSRSVWQVNRIEVV